MTQENKPDRLVIISKAAGANFEKRFFLDIQDAFKDGYRIAETNLRDDASMRNFRGRLGRAVLYKEGTEPEQWKPAVVKKTVEPVKETTPVVVKEVVKKEDLSTGLIENSPVEKEKTPLEQLEELDSYKDMKVFATANNITLPDKLYNPVAVKKSIKKALES